MLEYHFMYLLLVRDFHFDHIDVGLLLDVVVVLLEVHLLLDDVVLLVLVGDHFFWMLVVALICALPDEVFPFSLGSRRLGAYPQIQPMFPAMDS